MKKIALLAGVALAALAAPAHAALVTSASLFTVLPAAGSTTTVIGLQGLAAPSQGTVNGAGYTITFNTPADQGVVQFDLANRHAVPSAGISGGQETFLVGDFGSAQTTNIAQSGKYFSTDGAGSSITITFAAPQTSLALLWGSIDASNQIAFNNASNDVLTGATIQGLAAGFVSNGFQGPGGSAYVSTTSFSTFTTVTLSSGVVSFEATGLVGSNTPFVTTVPEPMSIALVGMGLLGLGMVRRRA